MRAGRRGVIVSNIAVTNGSGKKKTTKKNKKNFLRQVRIAFFLFLAADWTAGDDMPTVYDVQANNNTERFGEGTKRCLEGVVQWPGVGDGNSTQHYNITTRNRGRRSAETRSVALRWHVVDVVVGCV